MTEDKKIARIIGVLFLISMTASLIYSFYFSSTFDAPLDMIYPSKTKVIVGALLELINCFAVVGIAVLFFPILKRQSEIFARFYVVFRIIESTVLIVGVIGGLLFITLSHELIKAGAPEGSHYLAIATILIESKNLALQMGILIAGLGGLILTSLLYQSKIIPRIISTWGFIGYILVLTSVVLDVLGVVDTIHGKGIMMYILGSIFEFILLPIWLIVKGFDS